MHRDETTRTGGHADIDVPALDPVAVRALNDLLGGDREAPAELGDSFVDEAPERLAELPAGS